ncbi:toxin TcdB middle/N-terminal domain-containing protein [Mesorhizobium sp.]|uniref:toxin TcdB middle/N-terminal domain-containing protein n=1 Tax=Mesorhizobium sp. TaxID=1871066 RepID=UPI0025F32BBA|nr:toxin TcdB middle/N-terminal domain-containing protein [Mesorhizobium sp.]
MNKLLLGAALLAAGVIGVDTSFVSYIRGSAGIAAFAQEAKGPLPDVGAPSSGGLGNGGAALGGGQSEQGSGNSSAGYGSKERAESQGDVENTLLPEDDLETDSLAVAPSDASTASVDPELTRNIAIESVAKPTLPKSAGNTGDLSYEIPIRLPAFRQIEPRLALTYNSARRSKVGGGYQGWTGYGWGIDGLPRIERGRPRGGVPAFNTGDVYYLDGIELVPCDAASVSASCSAGGTHSTEIESYKRITFVEALNVWKITETDGLTTTLNSLSSISGISATVGSPQHDLTSKAIWLTASIEEPHGNTISYAYDCQELVNSPRTGYCYPVGLSYSMNAVQIFWEQRPDFIHYANGHDIGVLKRRISSIVIRATGNVTRVYALEYDRAPISGASRLLKVRQFGNDAVVNSAGHVSSGTERLPIVMAYAAFGNNFDPQIDTHDVPGVFNPGGYPRFEFHDFNSDGRSEILYYTTDGPFVVNSLKTATSIMSIDNSNNVFKAGSAENSKGHIYIGRFSEGTTLKNILYKSNIDSNMKLLSYTKAGTLSVEPCLNATAAIPSNYCSSAASTSPNFEIRDYDGDSIFTIYNLHSFLKAGYGDLYGDGRISLYIRKSGGAYDGARLFGATSSLPVSYPALNSSGAPSNFPCYASYTQYCYFGDFNGDGVTDSLSYTIERPSSTNQVITSKVYLGTGQSFVLFYSNTASNVTSGAENIFLESGVADLDGDGRDEFHEAYLTAGTRGWHWQCEPIYDPITERERPVVYSVQSGSSGVQAVLAPAVPAAGLMADINGDGLADISYFYAARWTPPAYPNSYYCPLPGDLRTLRLSRGGSALPNMLTSIRTDIGATISVEYTPSSRWTNSYLPQVLYAVSKLSVNDGRGQVADTLYTYEGGNYDGKARKFLGYRKVTETKPMANGETAASKIETTYRQDLASYGMPELTVHKDGASVTRKQVAETYAVNTTSKPYEVQNTATDTTLTENIARSLKVERVFDAYNNVTSIKDYGRTDVSGDETWTERFFSPNTSAYIVSAKIAERVHAGLDGSAPFISYTHNYYDGSTDVWSVPSKGNLTWVQSFKDYYSTPQKTVNQYFAYDIYGNKIAATNGLGHKTEWDYDATYHLYPIAQRSPRYFATGGQSADTRFVSSATYNAVCGQPATETDPNGIVKTFTYDAFCRPYQVSQSVTGAYAKTRFENEGNPATQALVKLTPLPNGAGEDFVRSYYDGLGRVYRVETPGETGRR